MQTSLYDEDLFAWAMTSAGLLRAGRLDELDRENPAVELESMGKSELRALESRLTGLLAHLLNGQVRPERRGKSWQRTLIEQRKRIARLLRDSPSLRPRLSTLLAEV